MKRALVLTAILLASSTICSAQQFTYYYPQIASGTFEGGFWKTTIFLTNATSGTRASGTVAFTKSDGSPFFMNVFDEMGNNVTNGNNSFSFNLAGGETRKYVSAPEAALSTGFATVNASTAVLGTAVFSQFDAGGRLLGEAGVPAAIPLGKQAILVDTANGFMTGVAIANPNSNPLHITFQLLNEFGQTVAQQTRDVPPFQHFSIFIHELFPNVGPMVGRLQFWCMNPMTAVGLRFDPSFALFTTLPPLAVQ